MKCRRSGRNVGVHRTKRTRDSWGPPKLAGQIGSFGLILPNLKLVDPSGSRKFPVQLEDFLTDPGLAQSILGFVPKGKFSKLPDWKELSSTFFARLNEQPNCFQVHWPLARAQAFWRTQKRLSGILKFLFSRLERKVPFPVFQHLGLGVIRGFSPFFRKISALPAERAQRVDFDLDYWVPNPSLKKDHLDSFWTRVLQLGHILAEDWEKDPSIIASFETAWPLIRELEIPAAAKVLDELLEEREKFELGAPLGHLWKPEELRWFIEGIRLGAKQVPTKSKLVMPVPDLGLVKTLVREELAEMAAGAGHEINNPLAILTGAIQKLHKDLLKIGGEPGLENLVHGLDLMKRQVQRVRSQIEDLMAFARPPEPKPTLVSGNEVLEIWEAESQSKGFSLVQSKPNKVSKRIRSKRGNSLLTARIDKDLFAKVGKWIIDFASSQIPTGQTKELEIRLKPQENDLLFELEYHLPPPKPSQILHLFTPFFCPKNFARSSGLQLAASRSVLEKMGGRISFGPSSEKGWTNIQIWVPRGDSRANTHSSRSTKNIREKPSIQPENRFRPVA